jgi:hypothetical protein
MGIFAGDQVERARTALADAEAAVEVEGGRVARATEQADRYATEAAAVDPDEDPAAAERAAVKLGQLHAGVELASARERAAKQRVEAARQALADVEQASARTRLAETNDKIDARQDQALDDMREALAAFGRAVVEIAQLTEEAKTLAARIDPGYPNRKVHGRDFAGLVGNPARAVLFLAERGDLRV